MIRSIWLKSLGGDEVSEVTKTATVSDSIRDRLLEISTAPSDPDMKDTSYELAVLAKAVLSILERLDKDLAEVIGRG